MMRQRNTLLVVAVALTSCSSPPMPPPSSQAVVDAETVASVSRAFRDAGIPSYQDIKIEASAGTVMLCGPVAALANAEQIVRVAQAAPGVVTVVASFDEPQSAPASRAKRGR